MICRRKKEEEGETEKLHLLTEDTQFNILADHMIVHTIRDTAFVMSTLMPLNIDQMKNTISVISENRMIDLTTDIAVIDRLTKPGDIRSWSTAGLTFQCDIIRFIDDQR